MDMYISIYTDRQTDRQMDGQIDRCTQRTLAHTHTKCRHVYTKLAPAGMAALAAWGVLEAGTAWLRQAFFLKVSSPKWEDTKVSTWAPQLAC